MNVPKLRFKEFNDEWQNICLKDVFEYYSTNSLSREQLSNNGIIKNIHYGDIHKKFSTIVNVEKNVDTYIKDINYKNKYELCKNNDLIFADASEDYDGIGKAIELTNVNCNTVSGLHTILARDCKNVFASKFKGYYFNSPKVHNQIRILANGFKVYGISKDTINKLEVNIPSINEQLKIANTLELLDKKIELQTKKIEDLKLFKLCIKKGLFSKINNHNLTKIENILEFEQPSKYIVHSEEYIKDLNAIPVLTANKAFILGYCDETGYYNKGNCIIFDDFTMDMKYVNFPFKVKSSALKILTPKENIDLKFVYEYLQYLNLHSEEHKRHYISTVQQLYIPNPDLDTQKSISQKLTCFDNLLLLETEKLNKLNALKKGLMQNMFV